MHAPLIANRGDQGVGELLLASVRGTEAEEAEKKEVAEEMS